MKIGDRVRVMFMSVVDRVTGTHHTKGKVVAMDGIEVTVAMDYAGIEVVVGEDEVEKLDEPE
jgi:hypothetical protein